jgi:hypothetical protein
MKDFERLLKNINSLDIDDIFKTLWSDSKVQNYIIDLNTEGKPTSQLYELGIDSKGVILGEYATSTIIGTSLFEGKIDKGQRFDHVTLKDTGGFYETFVVIPKAKGFELKANPLVGDSNLFKDWGDDIVGLTKVNQELLIVFIETDFNKELEKRLFQ